MAGAQVDILMYHSVSDAGGPTSIAPAVFRRQMEAIVESGVPVLTMDDVAAGAAARISAPRAVVLTFDDALADFAATAWPIMERFGFRPTVYVPTGHVGRREGWAGSHDPALPLMDWPDIRALHEAGVLFGSHTVSHADLNTLDKSALVPELQVSRRELEDRLGQPVQHFAPPYGRARKSVRQAIAAEYATSVSTRLGSATAADDLLDLPRVEMFYFTDAGRWREHLSGRGGGYMRRRRLLRAVRQSLPIAMEKLR